MLMLRFGLILLILSSVGVTLRSMEWTYMMGTLAKWICSAGLSAAIVCFFGTYFRIELLSRAQIRK